MKVNNNNDSVDLSQVSRSKHGQKAGKVSGKSADESSAASGTSPFAGASNVDLSSEAKSLASANSIAKTDDADDAKIARVKAMISAGTYKPDFGKVADKMINEHLLQETS
jgi:flagellar biosynthesis anti-sigma factor FlgM